MTYPTPGSIVTITLDDGRLIQGVAMSDRYPDSVLQVDTDRGVLRIPWGRIDKVVKS